MIMGLALASAGAMLSACGETPAEAPADAGIPGMKISNGRMVLAPVSGNPAAIYFDLAYDGDRNLALNRAEVKGAKSAMFHDYGEYDFKVQMMDMLPLPLKKGDRVEFKPGGKHLMVMEPDPSLKPGGKTEASVIVSGGGKQTFTVEIRAAGDER
ncbi:copper chaperone PCu(A)C [Tsuneonella sp. HG249]